MNYEIRYKAACERAKKELQACGSQDCDAARQIFRLFPELAESEDKKIKRELCKAIWTYIPYEKAQEYITWLKKQGEDKPTENESKALDADKVIEWLRKYWPFSWRNFTLQVDDAIEKFKKDFGL